MAGKIIRIHTFFTGRVQGVFFRANTRNMALELGLNGWVRNLYDGRVEAVFEGPEEKVNSIVNWCKHSIPRAKIITVDVHREEPKGITGFEVIR
ncbi:MAG: acylphosphatase [Thermoplasmata archaeon]|nr:acylphosphatase [Thermoplasmata archaeon]